MLSSTHLHAMVIPFPIVLLMAGLLSEIIARFSKRLYKSIKKENQPETWEFIFNNQNQELKSGRYANVVIKVTGKMKWA